MSRSNLQTKYPSQTDVKDIENIMVCAKWIVCQFEELECASLANVFQRAVEDAEAWIQTMCINNRITKETDEKPLSREAEMIRKFLVRFATIQDPQTRQSILDNMSHLTKKKIH